MAALRSGLRLAALGALALLAHGQQCTSGSHSSWSRVGHIDRITPVTTADGYGDNALCSWTLDCPTGSHVFLDISELETERSYDYISVYDGASASSQRIGHFSGAALSEIGPDEIDIEGNSHAMFITLSSDGSATDRGLSASFSCVPDICHWHDDGECDESSGSGLCADGTDTADCTCRWHDDGECDESSGSGLCADGTDTADCTCRWSNDDQCDEPSGTGLCAEGTDLDDCSCRWTNDDQCDESGGTGLCPDFSDVDDCRCGTDLSDWTNDGQCDEPGGTGLCSFGTDTADCGGFGRRLSAEILHPVKAEQKVLREIAREERSASKSPEQTAVKAQLIEQKQAVRTTETATSAAAKLEQKMRATQTQLRGAKAQPVEEKRQMIQEKQQRTQQAKSAEERAVEASATREKDAAKTLFAQTHSSSVSPPAAAAAAAAGSKAQNAEGVHTRPQREWQEGDGDTRPTAQHGRLHLATVSDSQRENVHWWFIGAGVMCVGLFGAGVAVSKRSTAADAIPAATESIYNSPPAGQQDSDEALTGSSNDVASAV
jgi:hypothetical protein